VLSQDTVRPIDEVLKEKWTKANKTEYHGVQFPDYKLRDRLIEALRQADLVGLLSYEDTLILTPDYTKRVLTDQILKFYQLYPALTCDSCITRVFPQNNAFWELLKGQRVLLLTKYAADLKKLLEAPPYNLNIALAIPFTHSEQIDATLDTVYAMKDQFDLALISCGVSAVILAQRIAQHTGKVTIDFGKSAEYMVKKRAGLGFEHSRFAPHHLD